MIRSFLVALGFFGLLLIAQAEPVDLLLAAASDAELQPLLAEMHAPVMQKRAAWTFWMGTLAGKKVVLTRTEGDPLNAVAATALALRKYPARLVITFGAARPHDPALQPGDVIVSQSFAAFDGMISPHQDLGTGSDSLKWMKLLHPMVTAGERETRLEKFPADASSLQLATLLNAARGRVLPGVLGSAHQVNREADRVAWLRAQWGTSCEDGESAHIAGCAFLLGVPTLGLRVIDGADGEAATLILQLLDKLP